MGFALPANEQYRDRAPGPRESGGTGEAGDGVHLYITGPSATSEELNRLHETLCRYPGDRTVFLHLHTANRGETIIELPDQLKVASTPELFQVVEELFGDRIVTNPSDL